MHPSLTEGATFAVAFVYTTLFMSPDMDIAHRIKWYSLRGLLSLPFRSYSQLFKHRGLSHSLLFGSLTRIVWLASFLFALLYICKLAYIPFDDLLLYCATYKKIALYTLAGIFLADASHILTDKLF